MAPKRIKGKQIPHPTDLDAAAPVHVDWRNPVDGKNIILTPIQEQIGQTCCHHAFGIALEAGYNILTKDREQSIEISIQELIDKVPPKPEIMGAHLTWIERFLNVHGVHEEEDYKPRRSKKKKKKKHPKKTITLRDFKEFETVNEPIMLQEVLKKPILGSVKATPELQLWRLTEPSKNGVFQGADLPPENQAVDAPDHQVLIVGYGSTNKRVNYWLIRNAWGETWGDGGYAKIARASSREGGKSLFKTYGIVEPAERDRK